MIRLITGVPGHFKTSLMMEELLKAIKANEEARAKGGTVRPLFVCGVDELDPGLDVSILEDARQWASCPDGALIFVDEAWKWFGHLSGTDGRQTPPEILGLAEHRHRGMDFVWTSQGINQIFPFARPLIAPHVHVVRRFNSMVLDVYEWGESVDDPKSQAMRDRSTHSIRTAPRSGWKHYKSASVHTMKTRIPFRVFLAIAAVVLVGLPLLYFGVSRILPEAQAARLAELAPGGSAAGADASPGGVVLGERGDPQLDPVAYALQFQPRVPGMHGSQPIFGEREVRAEPRTFCVISGGQFDNRCRCYTEQVTPIADVRDDVCRTAARHGAYDPFLRPMEARRAPASDGLRGVGAAAPTVTRSVRATGTDPAQVGGGKAMAEVW